VIVNVPTPLISWGSRRAAQPASRLLVKWTVTAVRRQRGAAPILNPHVVILCHGAPGHPAGTGGRSLQKCVACGMMPVPLTRSSVWNRSRSRFVVVQHQSEPEVVPGRSRRGSSLSQRIQAARYPGVNSVSPPAKAGGAQSAGRVVALFKKNAPVTFGSFFPLPGIGKLKVFSVADVFIVKRY